MKIYSSLDIHSAGLARFRAVIDDKSYSCPKSAKGYESHIANIGILAKRQLGILKNSSYCGRAFAVFGEILGRVRLAVYEPQEICRIHKMTPQERI